MELKFLITFPESFVASGFPNSHLPKITRLIGSDGPHAILETLQDVYREMTGDELNQNAAVSGNRIEIDEGGFISYVDFEVMPVLKIEDRVFRLEEVK